MPYMLYSGLKHAPAPFTKMHPTLLFTQPLLKRGVTSSLHSWPHF